MKDSGPKVTGQKESKEPKTGQPQQNSKLSSAIAADLSRIADHLAVLAARIDSELHMGNDVTMEFAELSRELSEQREAFLRADVQLADIRLQLSGEQSRRQRLEDDLAQLRSAIETMQLGVTIANQDGIIVYVNPADAKMHGYSRDELLGRDVGAYAVGYQHRPMSTEKLRTLTSYQRETFNRRKDGSIFKVRLLSDVVRNADGDPVGLVTMCEELPNTEPNNEEQT